MSTSFLVSLISGVIFLNIAPFGIWYYDSRLIPDFIENVKEIYEGDKNLGDILEARDKIVRKYWWIGSLVVSLVLTYFFWQSSGFMQAHGVWEMGGLFYYLDYCLVLMIAAYAGGGFVGFLSIQLLLHDFSSVKLKIDPLHPDRLGGLNSVGYGAIRTTALISTGSLLLPWGFQFLKSGQIMIISYPLILLYIGSIALSFIYPTVRIHNRANRLRENILDKKRKELRKIKSKLSTHEKVSSTADMKELILELEVQRIRSEYEDYKQVQLYPMQVSIIARLISSIMLPIGFTFLEFITS